MNRIQTVCSASVLALALSAGTAFAQEAAKSAPPAKDTAAKAVVKTPKRVLIVVFDQMRPEYAQRFDMKNVLSLQKNGVHFEKAYLGHTASETVVSHNVIVSGVYPKNQGWADEAFRDTKNLLGKGANAVWETGSMKTAEFDKLIKDAGYLKLADYLHKGRPGSKFLVVAQKGYVAESIAAPTGDIAVKMSDRQKDVSADKGCANLGGQWRFPDGKNVPAYLTTPKCGRFYVNSDKANDYGTKAKSPAWLYPLDGDRMVPGNNKEHLGGDIWVADAAIAMMEKEKWSGMVVSFGGIDKVAHMWGLEKEDPSANPQTTLASIAKTADEQFGRLLQKLKDLGQLKDTLIVITADHGANNVTKFLGKDESGASDTNWYYGKMVNSENYNKPSPTLKPLLDTGNVQFSYQSTMIETWLTDNSMDKKREAAKIMRTLPGVVVTYWRNGNRFYLDAAPGQASANFNAKELAWWEKHGQELVDTMAADHGPDVVGLLADQYGYGIYGDHGGANENDQRIPMAIWSSNIKAEKSSYEFRSVDILPTVIKAMGIKQTSEMDGTAFPVKFR